MYVNETSRPAGQRSPGYIRRHVLLSGQIPDCLFLVLYYSPHCLGYGVTIDAGNHLCVIGWLRYSPYRPLPVASCAWTTESCGSFDWWAVSIKTLALWPRFFCLWCPGSVVSSATYFWSYTTVPLSWICSDHWCRKPFVCNRVVEIQSLSTPFSDIMCLDNRILWIFWLVGCQHQNSGSMAQIFLFVMSWVCCI